LIQQRPLALDPTYCKAWNNRGNALSGKQRYAEALASYDRAVALKPHYHQAWYNRGLLLREMCSYGNAMASFEQAISIHPDPLYFYARETIWVKKKLFSA
jgi:tetratricopeptide (TPR) repeat protein